MSTTITRKLTLRTVGLTKGAIIKALPDSGSVGLMRIAGETTEAKQGQTEKGEFTRLLGDFVAVNLLTGEKFSANQAILPSFISEPLAASLRVSQAVGFALEIGAVLEEESAVGYRFVVKSLTEPEPTDRMRRLMNAAGISTTPALAAPAAA